MGKWIFYCKIFESNFSDKFEYNLPTFAPLRKYLAHPGSSASSSSTSASLSVSSGPSLLISSLPSSQFLASLLMTHLGGDFGQSNVMKSQPNECRLSLITKNLLKQNSKYDYSGINYKLIILKITQTVKFNGPSTRSRRR